MKPIPFKIDRNNRVNLPEQLANGFRVAIRSGYYKQGERLPSFAEIVRELDVSIRAPRDAMKILMGENLVRSRQRIGCEVMTHGEKVWKGRVLGVMCAAYEGSYYISVLVGAIRKAIIAAGYSFISVTIDRKRNGKPDFSQLDAMMKESVDFVIAVYPDGPTTRRLARYAVPSLAYVDVQDTAGLDTIRFFSVRDMIAITRRIGPAGIKKVLLAEYAEMPFVADVLGRHGVSVERLRVKPKEGFGYLEDIKRKSLNALQKADGQERHSRPDTLHRRLCRVRRTHGADGTPDPGARRREGADDVQQGFCAGLSGVARPHRNRSPGQRRGNRRYGSCKAGGQASTIGSPQAGVRPRRLPAYGRTLITIITFLPLTFAAAVCYTAFRGRGKDI